MNKVFALSTLLCLVAVGVVCSYVFGIPRVADGVVEPDETAQIRYEAQALAAAGEPARTVFDEETEETYVSFVVPAGEQRMELTEEAASFKRGGGDDSEMIMFADVNFDGVLDVGVLTSIGYMGVNLFHTYYTFNNMTKQYEEVPDLGEVPYGVEIDAATRTMVARMKDGPTWVEEIITYDGTTYTRTRSK